MIKLINNFDKGDDGMKSTTKWVTRWPERISYGLSDAADNLVFQMMTTYLLFFYTDVYGLTPSAVAILFVVARVADVVESFVIGITHIHGLARADRSSSGIRYLTLFLRFSPL